MARRRFQTGEVFLRGKNPVWVGRWREDILENNKVRRCKRSLVLGTLQDFPTKRLALRALAKHLDEVNAPTYQPRSVLLFGEFANQWKKTILKGLKPSTQSALSSHLRKHLLPAFGTYAMRDISHPIVQGWLSQLTCSPKTARNLVGSLRLMWNSARNWELVNHDPLKGLMLPRRVQPEPRYFTSEEVQAILAKTKEPYNTFFWIAAETGFRAGELCGLRRDDVDLNSGTVQVRQSVWRGALQSPKSRRAYRRVHISQQLQGRLGDYLAKEWKPNNLSLLFSTKNGTPWDANLVVKRKLYPILDALGIERRGLHAFRHFVASVMDRESVPLAVRMDRLGHAQVSTTMGYTHIISDEDKVFAQGLGDFLAPIVPPSENGVAAAQAATPYGAST